MSERSVRRDRRGREGPVARTACRHDSGQPGRKRPPRATALRRALEREIESLPTQLAGPAAIRVDGGQMKRAGPPIVAAQDAFTASTRRVDVAAFASRTATRDQRELAGALVISRARDGSAEGFVRSFHLTRDRAGRAAARQDQCCASGKQDCCSHVPGYGLHDVEHGSHAEAPFGGSNDSIAARRGRSYPAWGAPGHRSCRPNNKARLVERQRPSPSGRAAALSPAPHATVRPRCLTFEPASRDGIFVQRSCDRHVTDPS